MKATLEKWASMRRQLNGWSGNPPYMALECYDALQAAAQREYILEKENVSLREINEEFSAEVERLREALYNLAGIIDCLGGGPEEVRHAMVAARAALPGYPLVDASGPKAAEEKP